MQNIKLDSRLAAVASFVRNGSRVADIGTDHAYLPSYLVQNGISPGALACDIKEMPLKNAEETVKDAGLCDKIKTVLSNGLDNIEENSADDIVIAGMGGLLIAEILERCAWIKNENIRIIAQPMTHAEEVREFLIKNGFVIDDEKAASDAKHKYCVICAHYNNNKEQYPRGYIYYGELANKKDSVSKDYLSVQLLRLKKRFDALEKSKTNKDECIYLKKVISDFEEKIK